MDVGKHRFRVGSRHFEQSLNFSHTGDDAYVDSTKGNVVIASPLDENFGAVLRGVTHIAGKLLMSAEAPKSSTETRTAGEVRRDDDFIYVCTGRSTWRRVQLSACQPSNRTFGTVRQVAKTVSTLSSAKMASTEPNLDAAQFARVSKALAEPSRLEMLQKIGECKDAPTCSSVCEWLHLSPATISHHLKELESAGLVQIERQGKFAYITLRRDVLKAYVRRLSTI